MSSEDILCLTLNPLDFTETCFVSTVVNAWCILEKTVLLGQRVGVSLLVVLLMCLEALLLAAYTLRITFS